MSSSRTSSASRDSARLVKSDQVDEQHRRRPQLWITGRGHGLCGPALPRRRRPRRPRATRRTLRKTAARPGERCRTRGTAARATFPHSLQNFAVSLFSAAHAGHCTSAPFPWVTRRLSRPGPLLHHASEPVRDHARPPPPRSGRCPVTAPMKSSRSSASSRVGSVVRTVAVRGAARSSAISPKDSPSPRERAGHLVLDHLDRSDVDQIEAVAHVPLRDHLLPGAGLDLDQVVGEPLERRQRERREDRVARAGARSVSRRPAPRPHMSAGDSSEARTNSGSTAATMSTAARIPKSSTIGVTAIAPKRHRQHARRFDRAPGPLRQDLVVPEPLQQRARGDLGERVAEADAEPGNVGGEDDRPEARECEGDARSAGCLSTRPPTSSPRLTNTASALRTDQGPDPPGGVEVADARIGEPQQVQGDEHDEHVGGPFDEGEQGQADREQAERRIGEAGPQNQRWCAARRPPSVAGRVVRDGGRRVIVASATRLAAETIARDGEHDLHRRQREHDPADAVRRRGSRRCP